jgi:hypothetical protein
MVRTVVIRQQCVQELRDANDRPSAGGNGALDRYAAGARQADDIRRGNASELAAHDLQRDLASDGHGLVRPQSNPGRRQISQGKTAIGSGHRWRGSATTLPSGTAES